MAYIPKDAGWYIAQIVLEITVGGEAQNIIHINYLLVRADSPEQAYDRALQMGAQHETTYDNEEAKPVKIVFCGLRNLTVVYEKLEDGAELLYEEKLGVSADTLTALVRPKERLAVFSPIERSPGPNYASAQVEREARDLIERAARCT